jgi:hypothetical protein
VTDLDDKDPIVETAVLGKRIESFLETDVGQYLMGRAESEAGEATELLKRVSWWRSSRIRYLQNRIWVAESFRSWIYQALQEGKRALDVLEEHR